MSLFCIVIRELEEIESMAKGLYTNDIQRLYKVASSIVNVRQQDMDLSTIGQIASLKEEFLTVMPLNTDVGDQRTQIDKFFMVLTLIGLRPDLETVRDQILGSSSVPSLDDVFARLLLKVGPDGQVDRLKAHLVAKGYTQVYGSDYGDTFSPVAKIASVRLLLSMATMRSWPFYQLDIKNASSKKVITREEWERKLNDVKIRKEDMNKLVMNFLVTEGYVDAAEKFRMESGTEPDIDLATITDRMAVKKAVQCGNVEDAIEKVNDLNPEGYVDAAEKFRMESGTEPDIDLATITDRMAVKKAVQCGNVEDAIEKVNDLNPEILDTNPQLFFHLQQQRLIELIRNGKVDEALEFAQEELAPRGEENQSFLEELEKTVALLAFEDFSNCPVGELLDISQRLKTASEVNAAILTSQSHEKDPKLPSLLKMLIWAQNQLDDKAAYPRINDLSTARLEDPAV
uniref:CTLH domain-containing protein n=1 Tax=Vitis vinifera TaxID=29760 RepID=F6GZ85_VITVI